MAVLVADGRVLRNPFVRWDDHVTLYENPDFNPPTFVKALRYWREPHGELYIPVTYTFWWALAEAAWTPTGLDPAVFHAGSIVLHILAAWAVMAIALSLTDSVPAACAGALLFALHPVQVEPVAWASGAKDLLSGLLSLGAVGLFLVRRRSSTLAARRVWIGLATVAFVLAMLAKPSAVVTPLIIIAVEWIAERKLSREVISTAGAWLLLAVPVVTIARLAQPSSSVFAPPLWERPIVAADALGFYIQKLVWPQPLAIDYGRPPEVALSSPWSNMMVALAAALLVAFAARRRPIFAAAAAIWLAALLPYLGLVPFDFQKYSTVADHYLYLAMLGPAIALALLMCGRPGLWWVTCTASLVLLMIVSSLQTGVWRDSIELFEHANAVTPHNFASHHALGFLVQQNDLPAAEREYRAALEFYPSEPEANTNLAHLLAARGQLLEALEHYRSAAEAAPGDTLKMNNLAIGLALLRRFDEAESVLRSALQVDAAHTGLLHGNLGKVLLDQGRRDEARVEFDRALAIDPNLDVARRGMEQLRAGAD